MNERENRFVVKKNELNNVNQQIRDSRKLYETNAFDFTDIPEDEDVDPKQFLDIAENNVALNETEPTFNVIVDTGKDKYPFILK